MDANVRSRGTNDCSAFAAACNPSGAATSRWRPRCLPQAMQAPAPCPSPSKATPRIERIVECSSPSGLGTRPEVQTRSRRAPAGRSWPASVVSSSICDVEIRYRVESGRGGGGNWCLCGGLALVWLSLSVSPDVEPGPVARRLEPHPRPPPAGPHRHQPRVRPARLRQVLRARPSRRPPPLRRSPGLGQAGRCPEASLGSASRSYPLTMGGFSGPPRVTTPRARLYCERQAGVAPGRESRPPRPLSQ
jgi:hypothetical protein